MIFTLKSLALRTLKVCIKDEMNEVKTGSIPFPTPMYHFGWVHTPLEWYGRVDELLANYTGLDWLLPAALAGSWNISPLRRVAMGARAGRILGSQELSGHFRHPGQHAMLGLITAMQSLESTVPDRGQASGRWSVRRLFPQNFLV